MNCEFFIVKLFKCYYEYVFKFIRILVFDFFFNQKEIVKKISYFEFIYMSDFQKLDEVNGDLYNIQ